MALLQKHGLSLLFYIKMKFFPLYADSKTGAATNMCVETTAEKLFAGTAD